jgi:hypothetical protein
VHVLETLIEIVSHRLGREFLYLLTVLIFCSFSHSDKLLSQVLVKNQEKEHMQRIVHQQT